MVLEDPMSTMRKNNESSLSNNEVVNDMSPGIKPKWVRMSDKHPFPLSFEIRSRNMPTITLPQIKTHGFQTIDPDELRNKKIKIKRKNKFINTKTPKNMSLKASQLM